VDQTASRDVEMPVGGPAVRRGGPNLCIYFKSGPTALYGTPGTMIRGNWAQHMWRKGRSWPSCHSGTAAAAGSGIESRSLEFVWILAARF